MQLLARTCNTEAMNVERLVGRVMIVLGGLFWIFWRWGAARVYSNASFTASLWFTLPSIAIVAGLFVLSMFFERLTAFVCWGIAVAVIIWGVVALFTDQAWGGGVWMIMLVFYVLPITITGVLFFLAARNADMCTAEGIENS